MRMQGLTLRVRLLLVTRIGRRRSGPVAPVEGEETQWGASLDGTFSVDGEVEDEADAAARRRNRFVYGIRREVVEALDRVGSDGTTAHAMRVLDALEHLPGPEAAARLGALRAWVDDRVGRAEAEMATMAEEIRHDASERLEGLGADAVAAHIAARAGLLATARSLPEARIRAAELRAELDAATERSVAAVEAALAEDLRDDAVGIRSSISWLQGRLRRMDSLDLSPLVGTTRRAATVAVAVAVAAALLLLRPLNWQMIGGSENLGLHFVVPRVVLLAIPLLSAACAGVTVTGLARLAVRSDGLAQRAISQALATVLCLVAAASSALVARTAGASASALVDRDSVGLYVYATVRLPVLVGTLAALVAAAVVVLAPRRERWFVPGVVAGFGAPSLAYLVALVHVPGWQEAARVARGGQLLAVSSEVGNSLMAGNSVWLYFAIFLAFWQGAEWARAVGEVVPSLARRLSPANWIVAMLATVKLAYVLAGYTHALPTWLGGGAPIWDAVVSGWVWVFAAVAYLPALACACVAVRHTDAEPIAGTALVVAVVLSSTAITQIAGILAHSLLPGLVPSISAGDPIYFAFSTLHVVEFALVALVAAVCWRRRRAAALMALTVLLFLASTVAVSLANRLLPVVSPGHLDVMVSVLVAFFAWFLVARRRKRWGAILLAVLAASTVVSHGRTLVPSTFADALGPVAIVATLVFSLCLGAGPLNRALQRQPDLGPAVLGATALAMVVTLAGYWGGSKGLGPNTFLVTLDSAGFAAQRTVAYPVLLLLVSHAGWRFRDRGRHS